MNAPRRRRRHFRRRGNSDEPAPPPKPINWWLYGTVIGLAALAFLAIPLSAAPIDRGPLVLVEVMIVGLAFIVIGAATAVEKEAVAVDDALHYQRPGWFFRRPILPLRMMQAFYLLAIVFGLVRALIQPRHTWPAIAWIGVGCAVVAVGVGLLAMWEAS